MKKDRDANIDLIRIIAVVLVIAAHTNPRPLIENSIFRTIYFTVCMLCNGLFFFISGYFNLNKEFKTAEDTIGFYVNRMISIVFPLFLITVLNYLWDQAVNARNFSWYALYKTIMSGNSPWFLYSLIGFIISTPILSKAFKAMDNKELNIVFSVCIIWNIFSIYLTKNIGVNFAFNGWVLSGWITYYFLGFYLNKVVSCKNRKKFYISGLIGLFITLIGNCYFPDKFQNGYDYSVAYILFTASVYIFLITKIDVSNERLKRIIFFISKHSYTMILLHWNVLLYWSSNYMIISNHRSVVFIGVVIVTFVICLSLAIVLDSLLVFPCQKILRRTYNKIIKRCGNEKLYI